MSHIRTKSIVAGALLALIVTASSGCEPYYDCDYRYDRYGRNDRYERIGTGAAIVTIDMTTDTTTAKIGATVATVIADAMSEKQSVTTINVTNRARYNGALLSSARF